MGSTEAEKAKVEQKLQTLQFQNGKLSAQLEVQRSQISDLEGRLEAQDAKQSAYADTLLTVNGLWSQLNTDIQNLAARASKVRRSCSAFCHCCGHRVATASRMHSRTVLLDDAAWQHDVQAPTLIGWMFPVGAWP